ncbi:sugar ABC transporter ATP-binding protein [Brachyspira pilosicoli]|uniref:sugar ABC transporter ATP-binding protein n=1 Tax=Brachyspira pilosicoli TaxID=52584 RepID=UPI001C67E188|nr:sugar ABC transporter ATP-binding protein [Brachyspira pilosicoli]MBW5398018.1 sugar ABC transporter ATP-binding protein [Brachyspira pilosicoli]
MQEEYRLKVSHIYKSFPGVQALKDINFAVRKGTVHVLCGENGAGKSTLMKIINGIYKADIGSIEIDGKVVQIKNPIQAKKLGISMIFQELNYVPEMTVEESLVLGDWPMTSLGTINWKKIRKDIKNLLEQEGLNYSPTTKLKELTVSDVQMLEIIKSIANNAKIFIMDEPTSAITNKEVDKLFAKIEELKSRGASIIYISHKMDEIFKIADDITILRDGQTILTDKAENFDIDKVISLMVGRKLANNYPKETVEIGETVLEVNNLYSENVFNKCSFYARKGEIVGFAGLMGGKRTELVRTIFGIDRYTSGEIKINGKAVTINSVSDGIKNRIAMLSEDRRRFGIIPCRSVKENVSLASLSKFFYNQFWHKSKEHEEITKYCEKMNVKTASYDVSIDTLSGGNQQKVLLARWILESPDILIMDEPTRGIDVGAKFEIYKLMTDLVKEGKTLIVVSSELPELIGMCDRIYVMCKGSIAGMLNRDEFSQETIMKLATGTLTM